MTCGRLWLSQQEKLELNKLVFVSMCDVIDNTVSGGKLLGLNTKGMF